VHGGVRGGVTGAVYVVGVTIESIVVGVKSDERDELVATARRKSGNERVSPRVLVALSGTARSVPPR
jgi:hypothetical protein